MRIGEESEDAKSRNSHFLCTLNVESQILESHRKRPPERLQVARAVSRRGHRRTPRPRFTPRMFLPSHPRSTCRLRPGSAPSQAAGLQIGLRRKDLPRLSLASIATLPRSQPCRRLRRSAEL